MGFRSHTDNISTVIPYNTQHIRDIKFVFICRWYEVIVSECGEYFHNFKSFQNTGRYQNHLKTSVKIETNLKKFNLIQLKEDFTKTPQTLL